MTRLEAFCAELTEEVLDAAWQADDRSLHGLELAKRAAFQGINQRMRKLVDDIDIGHYGVESYMNGEAE